MISNTVLQKALDNGYDPNEVNNLMSICLLLSRAHQTFNGELLDYLQKFGLGFHNVKQDLTKIDTTLEKLSKQITPAAPKTEENKLNFFEDFDSFLELINQFRIKS